MYFSCYGETSRLLMNVVTFNVYYLLVKAIYEEIQFKTNIKLNEIFDDPNWPTDKLTDEKESPQSSLRKSFFKKII